MNEWPCFGAVGVAQLGASQSVSLSWTLACCPREDVTDMAAHVQYSLITVPRHRRQEKTHKPVRSVSC